MTPVPTPSAKGDGPVLVLGAGYAGLTAAHGVWNRTRGKVPIVLVDRHPVHVLRTELYEVGELASEGESSRWTVPLSDVLDQTAVQYREATVESIDLDKRTVQTSSGEIPFRYLAICVGSVGAYYGVPGAAEHAHQIYGLLGAQRLARAIRQTELDSVHLRGEQQPRIVVIGGGSTGTELAADIASTDWSQVTAHEVRRPAVVLVTGSLPFLAGLPAPLVRHARSILREAGVCIIPGLNTTLIEPKRVTLEDGTVLACEISVWCAGIEAPSLVRNLRVNHGKGGRISVNPTLEIPGFPGMYAVGDAAEVKDARSGMFVPQTAQAAVEEAKLAARNIVARVTGQSPRPFIYKERGVILAVGRRRGAATLQHVTIWGPPASWLKKMVERDYVRAIERGDASGLL